MLYERTQFIPMIQEIISFDVVKVTRIEWLVSAIQFKSLHLLRYYSCSRRYLSEIIKDLMTLDYSLEHKSQSCYESENRKGVEKKKTELVRFATRVDF